MYFQSNIGKSAKNKLTQRMKTLKRSTRTPQIALPLVFLQEAVRGEDTALDIKLLTTKVKLGDSSHFLCARTTSSIDWLRKINARHSRYRIFPTLSIRYPFLVPAHSKTRPVPGAYREIFVDHTAYFRVNFLTPVWPFFNLLHFTLLCPDYSTAISG